MKTFVEMTWNDPNTTRRVIVGPRIIVSFSKVYWLESGHVVSLLAELFISESKSQVYGAVHDFIRCNPEATEDITKLLLVNKFTAGQYA